MTDYRNLNTKHEPPPGNSMLNRPREGASIPLVAAILAVVIVAGGLILYGRTHTTSTAQLTPPTQSAPSETPKTQQPARSNPQGTQ